MTTTQPPQQSVEPEDSAADDAGKGQPVRIAILAGLVALLAIRGGWAPLLVVAGVVVMIFLHELGHYLAARWGGMKVTEFFIGFGPRIWSFHRGETEYGLKVIPAGAYVKVVGMSNLDEVDPADEDRSYRRASYPKRMLVAVAGSAMHFGQAIVLLFVLYAFVGLPGGSLTQPDREWEVSDVLTGSAADFAGLTVGDQIVEIDGERIDNFMELHDLVASSPNQAVTMLVERGGDTVELRVTLGSVPGDPGRGRLGIRRSLVTTTVGPMAAGGAAITDFFDSSRETLVFLGRFFTPSGIADFAGDVAAGNDDSVAPEPSPGAPVGEVSETPDDGRIISILGAVRIGSDLTEEGMLGFLIFFISINITIGIFNLLPVLPLDGGHVVIATYERIREITLPKGERHLVDMTRLLPLVYAVFIGLIMLGVTSIYLDLIDPVQL